MGVQVLLTNVDWNAVFRIGWEDGPRHLLKLLQVADCVEICRSYPKPLGWFPTPARVGGMNATFKRRGLPLKIVTCDPGEPWGSQTLTLKVIPPSPSE